MLGVAGALVPYFAAVFLVPIAFICSLIAYKLGQRGMGVVGIVLAIVGVMGIIYTSQKISEIAGDPFGTVSPQRRPAQRLVIIKAMYDAVDEGMTYERVRAIVGDPGEELSRTDVAGYTTVMYSWTNSDGSNMTAMFQNERLVTKAQFGLR